MDSIDSTFIPDNAVYFVNKDIFLKNGMVIRDTTDYSQDEWEYIVNWLEDRPGIREENPALNDFTYLTIMIGEDGYLNMTAFDQDGDILRGNLKATIREFYAAFVGMDPSDKEIETNFYGLENDSTQEYMSRDELIDSFIEKNDLSPRIHKILPLEQREEDSSYDYDLVKIYCNID